MLKIIKRCSSRGRFSLPLLLALLSAGLMTGCDRRGNAAGPPPEMPPPMVMVSEAVARDVRCYLEEIGKSSAREYVAVKPQVAGKVQALHFIDGANLKK